MHPRLRRASLLIVAGGVLCSAVSAQDSTDAERPIARPTVNQLSVIPHSWTYETALEALHPGQDQLTLASIADWLRAGLMRRSAGSLTLARLAERLIDRARDQDLWTREDRRDIVQRVISVKQDALGPTSIDLVKPLLNLADLLQGDGDSEGRSGIVERAMTLVDGQLDLYDPRLPPALDQLTGSLHTWGSWDQAARLAKRMLTIDELVIGVRSREAAVSTRRVARELFYGGRLDEARGYLSQAAAIYGEHPEWRDQEYANLVNLQGALELDAGQYATARKYLSASLAIREESLGQEDGRRVRGILAKRDPGAKEQLQALVSSRPDGWSEQVSRVGQSLNNLGYLSEMEGDALGALTLYEQTLFLWESVRGHDTDFAAALNELGSVYLALGARDRASEQYERALKALEASHFDTHEQYAMILTARAKLELDMAHCSDARRDLERALNILIPRYENILGAPAIEALDLLSEVDLRDGQFDAATSSASRALENRAQAYGSQHPSLAIPLSIQARAAFKLGRTREAIEAALRAATISERHVRLTAQYLPEAAALRYASLNAQALDTLLTVGTRSTESILQDVWSHVIRSRAIVLDAMAARHGRTQRLKDPDTLNLSRDLERSRSRLASLVLAGPGDSDRESYSDRLTLAVIERDDLERQLGARLPDVAAERHVSEIGLGEVLDAIPLDAVMAAFVRFDESDPAYGVFVAASSGFAGFLRLGSAASVDEHVSHWQRACGRRPGERASVIVGQERACAEAGRQLRSMIWDPVEKLTSRSRLVLLVPDGSLNFVNFGALPSRNGGWLLESGATFHILSAERDVLTPARQNVGTATSLLAVGSPDFHHARHETQESIEHQSAPLNDVGAYSNTHKDVAERGIESVISGPVFSKSTKLIKRPFGPLPGSRREVEEVCAVWRSGNPDRPADKHAFGERRFDDVRARVRPSSVKMPDHLRGSVLVDGWATEEAFKQAAPRFSNLHLATHSFFLGGSRGCSGGSTYGIGTALKCAGGAMKDPLLMSGLVLAGANQTLSRWERDRHGRPSDLEIGRLQSGGDDGFLTAEEIASMDLSAASWTVLSGCDTGAGVPIDGEGVLGLRRAFTVAGSRSLIMSLWPIDDSATPFFMRALYRARMSGLTTAECVRKASLEVLQSRRRAGLSTHPFYWASFVSSGDWR